MYVLLQLSHLRKLVGAGVSTEARTDGHELAGLPPDGKPTTVKCYEGQIREHTVR
jgi:hypothetical protein